MAQFIAAITIEFETFTPDAAVFCIAADDLDDALKAAEVWHAFVMQIDQQLIMGELITAMIEYDRPLRQAQDRHLLGCAGITAAVRDKGGGRVMPEQFIQCIRGISVGHADDRPHAALPVSYTHLTLPTNR